MAPSGVKRHLERGASYAWDADPWSRGDYAWFRPGQVRRFLPHLATPEGRVHFAGDHTLVLARVDERRAGIGAACRGGGPQCE